METLLDLLRHPPSPQPAAPGDDAATDRVWVQGRLPAQALSVDVESLGLLAQPLSANQARTLHQFSEPARFGRREKTLLDPAVRHTGEISADLIGLEWQPNVFTALKRDAQLADLRPRPVF